MLRAESLTDTLVAVVTGYPDRARHLVATTDELSDSERTPLWAALEHADPAAAARAIGDALRHLGAPWDLVNECYRAAFFSGPEWKELARDPLFAFAMADHSGSVLDKWPHYFPIYSRHLEALRGRPVRVLEIGVYRGGGMDMWRWYFGPEAHLVGIDIDEVTLRTVGQRHTVLLGDQQDGDFLRSVSAQHGPFDVVIDDGGHTMAQQIASVEALFPLLRDGGVYLVEDCHTSYWPEYEGGLHRDGTFLEWVKGRLDDLHGYHMRDGADHVSPVWTDSVGGLHVYDSLVVLERKDRFAPFAQQTGGIDFLHSSRPVAAMHAELIATRNAAVAERDEARRERDEARGFALEEARLARAELALLRPQLGQVDEELARTQNQLLDSWEHIKQMRRTVSWRVTSPLRRVRSGRG